MTAEDWILQLRLTVSDSRLVLIHLDLSEPGTGEEEEFLCLLCHSRNLLIGLF